MPLKVTIWKPETPEIHWKYDYRQIYGLDSGYHDYPWWETPHRQPELAGGEKFIPVKYGKYRRIFRRMGIYLNHRVNISRCSASASLNIFRGLWRVGKNIFWKKLQSECIPMFSSLS